MGKSTCKGCGIKIPTEESILINGKKYCSSCFDSHKDEIEANATKRKTTINKLTFKCHDCDGEFPMSVVQKHKGINRCNSCFEKWKKDTELFVKLRDYIYENQGKNRNKIILATKMIQTYVTEHGMSYNGIYLTLKYFIEEKGGNIDNGIGIVPYIYEEARDYFAKRSEIIAQISELDKPLVSYRVLKFNAEKHKPKTNLPNIRVDDIQI